VIITESPVDTVHSARRGTLVYLALTLVGDWVRRVPVDAVSTASSSHGCQSVDLIRGIMMASTQAATLRRARARGSQSLLSSAALPPRPSARGRQR